MSSTSVMLSRHDDYHWKYIPGYDFVNIFTYKMLKYYRQIYHEGKGIEKLFYKKENNRCLSWANRLGIESSKLRFRLSTTQVMSCPISTLRGWSRSLTEFCIKWHGYYGRMLPVHLKQRCAVTMKAVISSVMYCTAGNKQLQLLTRD